MKSLIVLVVFFQCFANAMAQTISPSIPAEIDSSKKYLFYLHGGIIQSRGIDAVSPHWGRYEYTSILDTLKSYGFNVISEARPGDTDLLEYAGQVAQQINTLLKSGVAPEHITVVGASMGAGMTLDIAIRVKNRQINYAVLGICREASWDAYLQHYTEDEIQLCGNFLSIYEQSDSYGSCDSYFEKQPCLSGYKEIKLNMGNGHGFLYKPYKEWLHPLVQWIDGG